ncbi:MAG: pyrophosphatase PpaX [Gorillibacterium sp.]|nr:pyrophosphatase PpaX [Gorillibacterium sp.]
MIDTILFDFDGTIVDTNELIITTFLHVLEGQTPEPFTRELIVPNMGKPLVEQLLMFSGRDEVGDLVAAYREYSLNMHDEMVREFPHVLEVIRLLHKNGIKLGVVTNKMKLTTDKGLELFGLNKYMDAVITMSEVKVGKPDPEGVRLAIDWLHSDPKRTLMVGDSEYDLQAAKRAGAKSAGVAWSLKGEAYLNRYRPDYMLHDMRELLPIVGINEG